MTEVRGARAEEMPAVLDMVPRVMGATREYFAGAYRNDPWGRPEHSRIVKVDGRIVSHIRLYDRWQRVGPVPVHVGCVGDVCTLPEYRKQGHCRALLEDALRYWDAHDYDLSMIVSGVGVYAACGWVTLAEQGFTLAPENRHGADRGGYEIRRFVRGEDLTAVAAVYAAYNAERSLATVRTSAYWEKHFSWIAGEIEEAFLVAEQEGQIVAYLRCEGGLRLAEFCYQPGHEGAVAPLLDAILTFAAKRRQSSLQGYLPADHPALTLARERPGFAVTETSALLFRLVNLRRLMERLQPLLAERARAAGVEGALPLAVDGQAVKLRVRPGWVAVTPAAGTAESPAQGPTPSAPIRVELAPAVFFPLLFGTVAPEAALAGVELEPARVLAGLFPQGAPVYWRTDVV
jgi:predicted N-acetyltransferase YhbS